MKCFYCEKEFNATAPNSLYCSDTCGIKSRFQKSKGLNGKSDDRKLCGWCNTEFAYCSKKFCSKSCTTKAAGFARNNARRARVLSAPSHIFSACEVIQRDGPACSYCGIDTNNAVPYSSASLNIDHIIPLSRGGHHAIYNAQILCRKCNILKGSKVSDRDHKKAESLFPNDYKLFISEAKKSEEYAMGKNNKSGVRGVFFDAGAGRWKARIERGGVRSNIGASENKEEAIGMRDMASKLLKEGVSIKDIRQTVKEAICRK